MNYTYLKKPKCFLSQLSVRNLSAVTKKAHQNSQNIKLYLRCIHFVTCNGKGLSPALDYNGLKLIMIYIQVKCYVACVVEIYNSVFGYL